MGLFPKDRNLARSPDRVELPVRASDFRCRAGELSLRLDAFLCERLTWRSRTSIQELVKRGLVQVGAPRPEHPGEARPEPSVERRPGRLLRDGMRVVVAIPPELRLPVLADEGELVVLYEDADVVAVDKPPLLPVHPSGRHLQETLIQRLHARFARALDAGDDPPIPVRLAHRLDRETSGLVLCGKTRKAHRKLRIQFERQKVRKEYLAIVHGHPAEEDGVCDLPIGPCRASAVRLKMGVAADGAPSCTVWKVVRRAGPFALVACRPETGRQHQIRVHLAALGHPLVGDKLYGDDEHVFLRAARDELTDADRAALLLPRHALHNHRIGFRLPSTGEPFEFTCPLAPDLARFLEEAGDGESPRPVSGNRASPAGGGAAGLPER